MPKSTKLAPALALVEIGNLAPALVAVDRACKTADVVVLGVESADSAAQCVKLSGPIDAVRAAGEAAVALARDMGSTAELIVLTGPRAETQKLAAAAPVWNPLLGIYDSRIPREHAMNASDAIGLLETQGLAAALHAVDEMLKGANVRLAGKEKIGAAYVTIFIRGDVAAVQAAIDVGREAVQRLGGKLILADVIARPHPDLTALLPAS